MLVGAVWDLEGCWSSLGVIVVAAVGQRFVGSARCARSAMHAKPSGKHLVALATKGGTWCNCLPHNVFDKLGVIGSDYGHDHPSGMTSVVDAGRGRVTEVAWSMAGPSPAGGSSFGLGRWLIWSYVGSNLSPRAALNVVEDGDASGS